MNDSIWTEIMRSPLDPDPDDYGSRLPLILPVVAAAVIGLAIGIFAAAATGSTPTTTFAAATTAAASTTTPPPAEPIVPTGYTDVGGVGLKALAAFSRDQNLYMVVNSITRSDLDRSDQDEFHVAQWVLVGDGVEVVSSRSIASGYAPGVRLVEFPGLNSLPLHVTELRLRRATEMSVRTGCNGCGAVSVDMAEGEVILDGLERPFAIDEPLLISVGIGITLSIDELQVTDEWGYVTWHVIDENDARLRVTLVVAFEGTDDPATEAVDPTLLVPPGVRGLNQQNTGYTNDGDFAENGSDGLDRVGELITDDNQPEQLVLRWTVEWQHPVGDPITLPLDNMIDLGTIS